MHQKGLAYRDLCLENILISNPDDNSRMHITIMDFGMALHVPLYQAVEGVVVKEYLVPPMVPCGKPRYLAPEVLRNGKTLTPIPYSPLRADVWSLGVVLCELLTGRPPCETASDNDKGYVKIKRGGVEALLKQWRCNLSPLAKDLLTRLLSVSPYDRLTASEIKNHPWLVGKGTEHGRYNHDGDGGDDQPGKSHTESVRHKNSLQEYCQRHRLSLPVYDTVHGDDRQFVCRVSVEMGSGQVWALSSRCRKKKQAEQGAAEALMTRIKAGAIHGLKVTDVAVAAPVVGAAATAASNSTVILNATVDDRQYQYQYQDKAPLSDFITSKMGHRDISEQS
jgi:serine/threonine protein kinase